MIQTELKLRTVAEYLSEPEARVIECVLAMQGIPCVLKNAETVGFLQADGNAIAGVTVQVAEINWDAAQAVLHEHRTGESFWNCAACGTDVDGDFDTCWRCGLERGSTAKPDLKTLPPPEPDLSEETLHDQDLRRAWWGSLIGAFAVIQGLVLAPSGAEVGLCLPWALLSAYSLWLLFRIDHRNLMAAGRWKFKSAMALDLSSIAAWLWLITVLV